MAWKEESNPSLGFDYLYLSEEDYHALPKGTVDAVAVLDMRSGETRWQLEAIIGQTHGIDAFGSVLPTVWVLQRTHSGISIGVT